MKGSNAQRAYQRGYAAAIRRAENAEAQLRHLKGQHKEAMPSNRDDVIEFCLRGAETMLDAVKFLLECNEKPNPAPEEG